MRVRVCFGRIKKPKKKRTEEIVWKRSFSFAFKNNNKKNDNIIKKN